ncbi:hypothetical protein [Sutcliffiella horikoshii]|uniref:hypothetical protein n=1 Tax=Sutcliffiella horikoshii TaxID=79883 RepID=UPI003CF1AA12
MHKANLDVAVALIFFTRSETLKEVFSRIKIAKPTKLFLIQDGARVGNKSDIKKIQECRDIVEEIDWECEVYKNYSDVNLGCGMRPQTGISWVFEHVDKAIILEDDCVPTQSFFPFCKEMLERYENDLRIGIISGFNYFQEYDFGGYSYGFVKTGGIWGWATWKDRWLKYDFTIDRINDSYVKKNLYLDISPNFAAKRRIKTWEEANIEINQNENVSYWDYQWGFVRHINSWLSIVPKYSQISNIGIGNDATHSGNNLRSLPKRVANFFFMDLKELELPLKHPDMVIPNRSYDSEYYKIIYPKNIFIRLYRKIARRFKKYN